MLPSVKSWISKLCCHSEAWQRGTYSSPKSSAGTYCSPNREFLAHMGNTKSSIPEENVPECASLFHKALELITARSGFYSFLLGLHLLLIKLHLIAYAIYSVKCINGLVTGDKNPGLSPLKCTNFVTNQASGSSSLFLFALAFSWFNGSCILGGAAATRK